MGFLLFCAAVRSLEGPSSECDRLPEEGHSRAILRQESSTNASSVASCRQRIRHSISGSASCLCAHRYIYLSVRRNFSARQSFLMGGVQLLVLGLTRVLTTIKRTAKSLVGSVFGGALVEMTSFDQRVIYVRILL